MEAKELRIGNYVQFANYEPHQLEREEFSYTENYANLEDYKPIKLTEEWFVKFGFEQTWYGYENEFIEIEVTGNKYLLSINCNEYTIGEYFKYVHQLQNLYFALTGKELTLQK